MGLAYELSHSKLNALNLKITNIKSAVKRTCVFKNRESSKIPATERLSEERKNIESQ